MAATKKPTESSAGFSAEEKAAMKERAAELKAEKRPVRSGKKAEADLKNVLDKIAEMPDADRALAQRVHELILAAAPHLAPKTWYGMPAYAKDGKVLCFFQAAEKFESRYCTLGFSDLAALDDGNLWPSTYALTALSEADEKTVTALVERAAG